MAQTKQEGVLVIEALQQPLLEALEQADTTPPVKNEDLAWRPFILVLVYYFVAGIKSGRRLLTHLPHADPSLDLPTALKKSTFFDAFRRFPAQQARKLFHSLLSRISFFPVPEMADLGVLCAVDGSHWPALARMSWAAVGINKPTILLHLAFGLNHMLPVGMLLTESNSSERKALKQMLQAGVTYVADRGYFAYYLFNDVARASAFFVIRAPGNVTYQVIEALPINLPAGLDWLGGVQDLKVHCDKGANSGTWRVVRFVIGECEFVLFSNRLDLSTWQIITIYAYRWQIELFFLFLKRTLDGLHLLSHSKNGLEIQFYAMLIATVLLLHFKQRNEAASGEVASQGEPVASGDSDTTGQAEQTPEEKPEPEEEEPATTSQGEQSKPGSKTAGARHQTRPSSPKADAQKPARVATIQNQDNAKWYRDLGKKLHTLWRISVHWLQTLRDNLARVWDPAVFTLLAGFAKPPRN